MFLLVHRVTERLLPTWLLMAVVACLPLLVQTNQPRYGMLRAASALTPSQATGETPPQLVTHLLAILCHPADAQNLLNLSLTAAMEAFLEAIPMPICRMWAEYLLLVCQPANCVIVLCAVCSGVVLQVLFHPKQLMLVTSGDDSDVRVWDLVSKSCVAVLKVYC